MPEFQVDGLVWGMSGVMDGNMSFLWGEHDEVIQNRLSFLRTHGIELETCVAMRINDGDDVVVATEADSGKGMTSIDDAVVADALVTDAEEMGLLLVAADCLPLIYFDPQKRVLGIAHLSWKTSMLNLAGEVVAVMQKRFGCNPQDIRVFLGPGAGFDSYTFADAIQNEMVAWEAFIKHLPNGDTAVDLFGYNREILLEWGIAENNISQSAIDTIADEQFFSHYRAETLGRGNNGRNATVVMMK